MVQHTANRKRTFRVSVNGPNLVYDSQVKRHDRVQSRAWCAALMVMLASPGTSCRRATATATVTTAAASVAAPPVRPASQLPLEVPERESSQGSVHLPRVFYDYDGLTLPVESPVSTDAVSPFKEGLMITDPEAAPGARYFVVNSGIVGELELTSETCPAASDGTVQRCLTCNGDYYSGARFARWIGTPTWGDPFWWSGWVVGPIDAESRHTIRELRMRNCRLDRLPAPWRCRRAVDLDADGVDDLLATYMACDSLTLTSQQNSRCFASEVWSRTGTRWSAIHWYKEFDYSTRPKHVGLDIFTATIENPEWKDLDEDRFDVYVESATFTERMGDLGATLLMIDTLGPLASLVAGPFVEGSHHFQRTAMYLHAPDREPQGRLFAVGPVHGDWDELARTQVRSDFPDGFAYNAVRPGVRDRVVLAVDLGADGVEELELIVHGVAQLWPDNYALGEYFEVWVSEGPRRRLRETALEWSLPRAVVHKYCGLPESPEAVDGEF